MSSEVSSQDVLPATTTREAIAELNAAGSHTTSDAGSDMPGHSHSKARTSKHTYVTGDAALCKQSQQSKLQGLTTPLDNITPGVNVIPSCIGLISDTKIGDESSCVEMLKEQAQAKDSALSATESGRRSSHMPRTLSTTKAEAASAADPTNLIVNYIPASVNEDEFKSMFEPFGEISSYRLIYDRLTGRHIGYGFVKFSEASSAEKAILKYDGFPLKNKLLKVSYARPSGGSKRCNVYISGMPVFYTEEQLADLFAPFGSVEDSKILRNDKGESRGVGFARLSTVEAAEKAIENLHNTVPALGSSRISVKYADRGERRSLARSNRSSFVSRQSLSPNSSPAYESLLYGGGSYFNFGYGPETASMYGYNPQGTAANYSPPQTTYAPIHPDRFSSLSSVFPASPPSFRSISDAGPSYTSQTNVASQTITDAPVSPLGSPSGQYAGVCLFCFHLPYELDEPGLQGMFEPYGTVVHVKVMRDLASGQSKGYGFVNMQTFQQALTAISSLNGYALGGKHLKVEFKKPSQRRRTTPKISQQEQLKEMKQQMYT